ncbi:Clp protease N-terminal domain-containing protein [Sphaerisporangium sp. B11E5]|uniref:Clp protease N-terminal domain-containing protein n=1 Tax=Sphaerisporangium sp. B11E5 TaxID=3153563 RepID=UPI00325EB479
MFERFTDPARRVVVVAQEEARRLHHSVIGTEHILLGLLGEPNGLGGAVLREAGLTLDQVRADVRELGDAPADSEPAPHIPFGARAKKVLELSLREAMNLHHNYIGTEHILLGLMREAEGTAARILERHEIDFKRTREALVEESGTRGRVRRFGGALEEPALLTQSPLGARLERIMESLERIERRLDAFGVPPAPEHPAPGGPAPQQWIGPTQAKPEGGTGTDDT